MHWGICKATNKEGFVMLCFSGMGQKTSINEKALMTAKEISYAEAFLKRKGSSAFFSKNFLN